MSPRKFLSSRVKRSITPVIDLVSEPTQKPIEAFPSKDRLSPRQVVENGQRLSSRIIISKIQDHSFQKLEMDKTNRKEATKSLPFPTHESNVELRQCQQSHKSENRHPNNMPSHPKETQCSPLALNRVQSEDLNTPSKQQLQAESLNSKVRAEQFEEKVLLKENRLLKAENACLKQQCKLHEHTIKNLELKQAKEEKRMIGERKRLQVEHEKRRKEEAQFLEEKRKFENKQEKWKQMIAKSRLELWQAKEKIRKLETQKRTNNSADNKSASGPPVAKNKRSSIQKKKGKKRKRTAPLVKPVQRTVWQP